MKAKVRDSNIELFRILMMFLITVHHYFVNSGLVGLAESEFNTKSLFLHFWGMWGHIGTNCFVLITGYFMCTSRITLKKFLKLFLEIETYNVFLFLFFIFIGKEHFTVNHFLYILIPVHALKTNFAECYLVFYILIPFLNVLVNNIDKKAHAILMLFCILIFSFCAKIPGFQVESNYVEWFCVIYIIGSFIRKYPYKDGKTRFWFLCMSFSIIIAFSSVIVFLYLRMNGGVYPGFTLLMAAQAPFALLVAVCAFMFFKSLKIKPSRFINIIGAGTFGVLLIHANSETMRHWLWHDVFCNTDYYGTDAIYLHAFIVPTIVFIICSFIEYARSKSIEKPLIDLTYAMLERIKRKNSK